jgi:SulP family sulfate permease
MVLAAFLFMHRMAEAVELETHVELLRKDLDDLTAAPPDLIERSTLPPGVEVFRLDGPFFFGAATHFEEALARSSGSRPRVIVLRLSRVPLIDAAGVAALKTFIDAAKARSATVILSGARPRVAGTLDSMKVSARRAENFPAALAYAKTLLQPA